MSWIGDEWRAEVRRIARDEHRKRSPGPWLRAWCSLVLAFYLLIAIVIAVAALVIAGAIIWGMWAISPWLPVGAVGAIGAAAWMGLTA